MYQVQSRNGSILWIKKCRSKILSFYTRKCGSDFLNERYCYTEGNGEIRAGPGLDRPPRTTRVSAKKILSKNLIFVERRYDACSL